MSAVSKLVTGRKGSESRGAHGPPSRGTALTSPTALPTPPYDAPESSRSTPRPSPSPQGRSRAEYRPSGSGSPLPLSQHHPTAPPDPPAAPRAHQGRLPNVTPAPAAPPHPIAATELEPLTNRSMPNQSKPTALPTPPHHGPGPTRGYGSTPQPPGHPAPPTPQLPIFQAFVTLYGREVQAPRSCFSLGQRFLLRGRDWAATLGKMR